MIAFYEFSLKVSYKCVDIMVLCVSCLKVVGLSCNPEIELSY